MSDWTFRKELASRLAETCAIVCDACAEECARHSHEPCQRAAEACRACLAACDRLARLGVSAPSGDHEPAPVAAEA